ncbi:hypothetical protein ACFWY9_30570 [Amycolatopsis sp. NPDC059027]|uniref:hypothetical protein n=1 Tax=Amycolatopsis sp. NPDC059027 TaxID=3346709 RepID=UPI003670C368
MPLPTQAPTNGTAPSTTQAGIPFIQGSNHKNTRITSFDYTLTAGGSQEFVTDITPGGFLRGVRVSWSSTGGVLGSGTLTGDGSAAIFQSISLENLDGGLFVYPMNGFAHKMANKYFRPWEGDPVKRTGSTSEAWSDTINPSGSFKIYPELRDTAGVLANSDARAKYRIRMTLGPGASLASGAVTTFPKITVTLYAETWSQTDARDLQGNAIQELPPGLALSHVVRHQIQPMSSGGSGNTWQLTNTGNEIRAVLAIVRDANGVRQDYLTDPIRRTIDDKTLGVESPNEVFHSMEDFYDFLANGTSTRETGVYVWPRFRRPGDMVGQYWMPTNSGTYYITESSTAAAAGATVGTVEWITDEIVPLGPIPRELDGI